MPPQTNITETNPHINHADHAYKCTGRACPCPVCPASLTPALSLTPISLPKTFMSQIQTDLPHILSRGNHPHLFSSNGLPLTFASFQKNYVAKSDRFSPHSLAWQPMKRRGYPLLATSQPAPGLWWIRFVEIIKIARIPPVVYTKSHHSSCDILSLLTYRSYRSVSRHL
jgi:hypothetical protein